MTKKACNVESFSCIWLDENVNSLEENLRIQDTIRQAIHHLCTYNTIGACEEAIKQVRHEKIIFIVSNSLGKEIVPRIHHLSQLFICYLFDHDKLSQKKWSHKYSKIKGTFTQESDLIAALTKDQKLRSKLEEGLAITIISSANNTLDAHHANFLWFQLFIEVLLRMHQKTSDRQELIDLCTEYYRDNPKEMKTIQEFAKTYQSKDAIFWYTRDTCFYRMMNKALRVQDYSMLFAFRFFLTDIAKQIQNQHETFIRTNSRRRSIRIFRGQAISNSELELMQNNLNSFISMNAFLSTSRKRSVAIEFARGIPIHDQIQPILFEINIDPRLKTKAFADIQRISYYAAENEILITLGALFHLESLTWNSKDQMWIARMNLANEDDYQLKEIFAFMKKQVGDETNLDSLGKILREMGEHEQAQKFYQRMIEEHQLGLADAQHGFGLALYQSEKYNESLLPITEALKTRLELLGETHIKVAESYRCLGAIHWKQGQCEAALHYLKKAIDIHEMNKNADPVSLERTYHTTAVIYQRLQQTEMTIQYYHKALEVQKENLPHNHPDLALTYNNLGYFHEKIGELPEALEYYHKSLEISRETLPATHIDIRRTERSLKRLSEKMERRRI